MTKENFKILSLIVLMLIATLNIKGLALVFRVTVPEETKQCYIVGIFDDWENFRKMTRIDSTNVFTLEIPAPNYTGEYQYCSGPGWEYEEVDDEGYGVAHSWQPMNTVGQWKAVYDIQLPEKKIKITATVPDGTNEVYVIGSHNNWSMEEATKAVKNSDGTFSFTLQSEEPSYQLVWSEEFNEPRDGAGRCALPGDKWLFEIGGHGWGNNEEQYYVDRVLGTDTVAKIQDGSLIISAFRLKKRYLGKRYISARMNTYEYWLYGRFEMRAKLPHGRGVWPAFWMLPRNIQSVHDGEIDIMEYVGYDPGVVHFSIHTGAYTPAVGTGKNARRFIPDCETAFHVYAVEWTEDYIAGFIDDDLYFVFENDYQNNPETWPFYMPFNLKINLAVGGDWGGYEGIDNTIFPARYVIDYVRVYQRVQ
ncbi:MAG: Beta-glucanase precursor [Bacteroidetes bacterium ADurb.Bin174]|nr:MAG: Beta-glucanase precursor [Bacteroidetes bacterium ADurb.Bin174]